MECYRLDDIEEITQEGNTEFHSENPL